MSTVSATTSSSTSSTAGNPSTVEQSLNGTQKTIDEMKTTFLAMSDQIQLMMRNPNNPEHVSNLRHFVQQFSTFPSVLSMLSENSTPNTSQPTTHPDTNNKTNNTKNEQDTKST